MALFKVIQQFVLPSVFVGIFILIGLILWKRKLGKVLLIIGFVLYYFFSLTPVADLLLLPLENQYSVITENNIHQADTIVLLLGGKETNDLRASEILRLWFLKTRALEIRGPTFLNQNARSDLESRALFKIIISGSSLFNPQINQAQQVKEFLIQRGVSGKSIILEDKSRTTYESAKNVKELLNDKPFFLITSAYHMKRSMNIFQKAGTSPIPAPADFKAEFIYNITDLFPHANNLRRVDLAFHEYFGLLYYKLIK